MRPYRRLVPLIAFALLFATACGSTATGATDRVAASPGTNVPSAASPRAPAPSAAVAAVNSSLAASTLTPAPTSQPTPAPTTATQPLPTTAPKTPAPTAAPVSLCGAPANPWNYGFCGGTTIASPPSNFCSFFNCIASFATGRGYVVQCGDLTFSKSGGISGSCSQHGGTSRTLYVP